MSNNVKSCKRLALAYELHFNKILILVILVQIRFLKTRYLGQHNEGGALINPIIPLDDPVLGGSEGV